MYNNLGRHPVAARQRHASRPASPPGTSRKATEAAPESPDYVFNLGYAYWLDKDTPAAIYWLREVVRRRPADGEAHFMLGAALQAANNTAEASRERELARQLSSRFDDWEHAASGGRRRRRAARPRAASEAETSPVRADSTLVSATQQDYQQLARFHFDRGQRLDEQQQDREAIAEFRKSLYLSPYDAQTHLALGRVLVRAGRLRDAIESLKISLWSAESLEARLLLAETLLAPARPPKRWSTAERALQLAPRVRRAARALSSSIRAAPRVRTP